MNLIDYIDRGITLARERDCLVSAHGSVRLTYAEVEDLSHRIAARLREDGFGPGSRVGVYSPNDPIGFVVILGVLRAGATWIAMNARSSTQDLSELLAVLECDLLILHRSLAGEGAEISADLAHNLIYLDELDTWMAAPGTRVEPAPLAPDAVAMLLGTGGTTGKPKGVPITNLQLHLMSLALNAHLPEPDPPVYIMAAPMTHAAGPAALSVLAMRGTIVVHNGFAAGDILDSIEKHRVTRILLPPTALYTLLAHPDVRERDYSSLRYVLLAAAPVAAERLAEAVEVFGPVLAQVYGQAEAPLVCTVLGPEEIAEAASDPALRHRLESCGRPSVVAAVEIMDERGNLCGTGERGEIVIRSSLVMRGYHNNPEATAEARRPGGWHGTGDIGYRDEHGYIYIVDRKKDMIISGGFNVFPSEIEQVIHTFPEVSDCAVIGIPDKKWGEAVTAVVEPKPGREIDTTAILTTCRARLGAVKTPKSVIVRELPRSPVGKVLKRALRDEHWAGHNRVV